MGIVLEGDSSPTSDMLAGVLTGLEVVTRGMYRHVCLGRDDDRVSKLPPPALLALSCKLFDETFMYFPERACITCLREGVIYF